MGELTADSPKCMLPLFGRPLLEWQIMALRAAGITDVTIVAGYNADRIQAEDLQIILNPAWADTNMVFSLMCASAVFLSGDPVVVAYGDIVYETRLVKALLGSDAQAATVVDRGWLELWRKRFSDPLEDAETLRLSDDGALLDIGRQPKDVRDIEGQYIGLSRFSAEGAAIFADAHSTIDQWEPGKSPRDCYFTDVLRSLISQNHTVEAVLVDNGWLEFDSASDVATYLGMQDMGRLGDFWSPAGVELP